MKDRSDLVDFFSDLYSLNSRNHAFVITFYIPKNFVFAIHTLCHCPSSATLQLFHRKVFKISLFNIARESALHDSHMLRGSKRDRKSNKSHSKVNTNQSHIAIDDNRGLYREMN